MQQTCILSCNVARKSGYDLLVPRSVQIRDLDDAVYDALARRAAETGVSVPELLRAEAVRLAARPSTAAWLERVGRRRSTITTEQIVEALDEQRGPWPDAGR